MDGAEGARGTAASRLCPQLIANRGVISGGLLRGGCGSDRQRGRWSNGASCLRADQAPAGRGVLAGGAPA
eukprot:12558831-Alexandrium_andersonii.AAC.1